MSGNKKVLSRVDIADEYMEAIEGVVDSTHKTDLTGNKVANDWLLKTVTNGVPNQVLDVRFTVKQKRGKTPAQLHIIAIKAMSPKNAMPGLLIRRTIEFCKQHQLDLFISTAGIASFATLCDHLVEQCGCVEEADKLHLAIAA